MLSKKRAAGMPPERYREKPVYHGYLCRRSLLWFLFPQPGEELGEAKDGDAVEGFKVPQVQGHSSDHS